MNKLQRLPQPLKYFSYVLISSSVFGIWLLYDLSQKDGFDLHFSIFVAISMVLHLIVGFSILSMKRWGHTIFKCYLYLLFLAIPIGTYISYKTLKYMEARRISELYD